MRVCDRAGRRGSQWRAGQARRKRSTRAAAAGRLAVMAGLSCALVMALGGCSRDASPSSYKKVSEVIEALEAKGVTCSEVTSGEDARLVRDSGRCRLDGETVIVRTFGSRRDLDQWIGIGGAFGHNLVGPTWVVTTGSRDTAEDLSEALGGRLR